MRLSTLLGYFAAYEVAAYLVNKQKPGTLPLDFLSQMIPPATAAPAPGTVTVQSPVGNLTLTSPLITPGGAIPAG